jgi:hypothetical protein
LDFKSILARISNKDKIYLSIIALLVLLIIIQIRVFSIYSTFFSYPDNKSELNKLCEIEQSIEKTVWNFYQLKEYVIDDFFADNDFKQENLLLVLRLLNENDTDILKRILQASGSDAQWQHTAVRIATSGYNRNVHNLLIELSEKSKGAEVWDRARQILHLRLIAMADEKMICRGCKIEPYIFYEYLKIFR